MKKLCMALFFLMVVNKLFAVDLKKRHKKALRSLIRKDYRRVYKCHFQFLYKNLEPASRGNKQLKHDLKVLYKGVFYKREPKKTVQNELNDFCQKWKLRFINILSSKKEKILKQNSEDRNFF